ncbi:helix-turn-helix transcriptional regulator [Nemorincola caseinilytica]|uniref:helix-turn-helix transcriptional regulator n=1 Tax=Nemorincola caseinilytica TaxID=2054315 RepID=UPI0031E8B256
MYIPSPPLAAYVKCIWSLQVDGEPGILHKEKILPDGCIELIFHYGDKYRQYDSNEGYVLQPRSFVHGQMKSYIEVGPTGHTGMVAARFYPHGLAMFTKVPMQELTGLVVDVHTLFGSEAMHTEEQLGNARNEEERVAIMERFLLGRLRAATPRMDSVAYAVQRITANGGNIAVSQLAAEVFMSERQFERVFLATVGLSAKAFSKITRSQNGIKSAQAGKTTSLTQLALDAGYYDQAHFIRDFKEFAGVTPMQFFSDTHTMSDLFTGS